MAKRPKVPAVLHSELTEYSSLLRALRTSSILDLAQHLTEPPPAFLHASSAHDDGSLVDEHGELVDDPPLTDAVSRALTSDVGSSERSRVSGQTLEKQPSGKGKQRDTWTRWPLLAGDVHVPEFDLQEEVRHVAGQVMTSLGRLSPQSQSRHHDDVVRDIAPDKNSATTPSYADDADHPALSSLALRSLSLDSAAFLARLLALLAAHVPNTDKSMRNRLRPISWETVIDVACSSGVVTADTAEHIRDRMSRIYPPSQPSIAHRSSHLSAMRHTLAETLSRCDASLLALPGCGDGQKRTFVCRITRADLTSLISLA
ncbi:hypothetical protein BD413DRAFT_473523 [Trametes elegans]|nr:hypothetical protein BD413DRAFT_473523 [Trametes elegans]